jgi:Protein of unknown function (DUF3300)
MTTLKRVRISARQVISALCAMALVSFPAGAPAFGQDSVPLVSQQTSTPLTPEQLDNMVAPIALYPDPLLGQVLAACTYPLEVVEAQQWLQQNGNVAGADLINAAKQQNWDPSVQALVAFPDVLSMLNRDIRWTSDLGNAFLAQQQDVMAAVQRMRARAQQNGKLTSTAQQIVTTQTQDGQSAVVIEPANPQVIYVPEYDPEYIWGPPAWGYYPPLWYPPVSFGFGFYPGIYLNAFFPGWGGFGWGGGLGWGWGCGWFGGGLFVNNAFFNNYGFHGYYGGYGDHRFFGAGREGWQHDPYHRAGVPYGNSTVAARYNNARFTAGRAANAGRFMGGSSFNGGRSFSSGGTHGFNSAGSPAARGLAPATRGGAGGNFSASGGGQRFNGGGSAGTRGFAPENRGFDNSIQSRGFSGGAYNGRSNSPAPAYRGYSGSGFSGPSRGYSAPRTFGGSPSYSTPRSFGGGARSFGGGGFSGGRSFGGGGGFSGRSSGGGHGGGRR